VLLVAHFAYFNATKRKKSGRDKGKVKSDLDKASGSLSKTYRDCREKGQNAQKGPQRDKPSEITLRYLTGQAFHYLTGPAKK